MAEVTYHLVGSCGWNRTATEAVQWFADSHWSSGPRPWRWIDEVKRTFKMSQGINTYRLELVGGGWAIYRVEVA